ncbi:hypothetical protein R1flu_011967 [Riccia fluitans]|uniref:Uncharacterized protein n=1 Tax=Riccia fluitans TaxID=41844 RepID=A0ABD1Z9H7_9MARC
MQVPREQCIVRKLSNVKLKEVGDRIPQLQMKAVVLYNPGQNPWRDTIGRWIQEHCIRITHLKVIDQGHYLVTFETEADRGECLHGSSIPAEWLTHAVNTDRTLHLSGQDNYGRNKFVDVQALVLQNAKEEWLPAVILETAEGDAKVKSELQYEPILEGCFTCHQIIAWAPSNIMSTNENEQEDPEEAEKKSRRKSNKAEPNMVQGGEEIFLEEGRGEQEGPLARRMWAQDEECQDKAADQTARQTPAAETGAGNIVLLKQLTASQQTLARQKDKDAKAMAKVTAKETEKEQKRLEGGFEPKKSITNRSELSGPGM